MVGDRGLGNLAQGHFRGQAADMERIERPAEAVHGERLSHRLSEGPGNGKEAAKAYLEKPGTKPAINFLVEFTPRFPDPVWRVMWGESAGSAEFTVFVDATTGKMVGKE